MKEETKQLELKSITNNSTKVPQNLTIYMLLLTSVNMKSMLLNKELFWTELSSKKPSEPLKKRLLNLNTEPLNAEMKTLTTKPKLLIETVKEKLLAKLLKSSKADLTSLNNTLNKENDGDRKSVV